MARISTHVLDTSRGRPAAGIGVELYQGPLLLATTITNSDGRTDWPLLERERIDSGLYTLIFQVGEYLRKTDASCVPFFDVIRIQFSIGAGDQNYHVPLLLSPYAYSTYRGS
jgi:hydroxyisourate hydrolase